MRGKKIAVFFVVYFLITGLITVDRAYSDMLDLQGRIAPEIRRVDEDHVHYAILGQTISINTTELTESWVAFRDGVVDKLEFATTEIRSFIGAKEIERDYSVFQLQML